MQTLDRAIHARRPKVHRTLSALSRRYHGSEEAQVVDVECAEVSTEGERRFSTEIGELSPVTGTFALRRQYCVTILSEGAGAHHSDSGPMVARFPGP